MIISYVRIRANDYYSCDLTTIHPVKVIIRAINGDLGLGLVRSENEVSIQHYIRGLEQSKSVEYVRVTHKSSRVYWTEVKQYPVKKGIYSTVLNNNSMSQLPIVIENGWQYHQILSPSANSLKNVISDLNQKFTEVELLRSTNTPDLKSEILTSKQEEIIDIAFNCGYYELPRKITIAKIGDIIGISRSASQERLHRAEKSIISYFLDDYRYNID